jgi:mevalonate kinase
MTAEVSVSAPGKLFLVGEYAVLAGATAAVAAIDRRAVARFPAVAEPSSAIVREAVRAARAHLAARGLAVPAGAPEVDSRELNDGAAKLGLGSSAAVTVAAIGALLAAAGEDVASARGQILELALAAHRAAQGGRGSGGDVMAAVTGGVIAFASGTGPSRRLRALPLNVPGQLVVFRAGLPTTTVDHLLAVERLAAQAPAAHAVHMAAIADAAEAFLRAYDRADVSEAIAAIAASHDALGALGAAADVPIATPTVARAAELARSLGGAAKSSGAGGGDVGFAWLPDRAAAAAFRARASAAGIPIVSCSIDPRGVARES